MSGSISSFHNPLQSNKRTPNCTPQVSHNNCFSVAATKQMRQKGALGLEPDETNIQIG